jgi:hypothetical protein
VARFPLSPSSGRPGSAVVRSPAQPPSTCRRWANAPWGRLGRVPHLPWTASWVGPGKPWMARCCPYVAKAGSNTFRLRIDGSGQLSPVLGPQGERPGVVLARGALRAEPISIRGGNGRNSDARRRSRSYGTSVTSSTSHALVARRAATMAASRRCWIRSRTSSGTTPASMPSPAGTLVSQQRAQRRARARGGRRRIRVIRPTPGDGLRPPPRPRAWPGQSLAA